MAKNTVHKIQETKSKSSCFILGMQPWTTNFTLFSNGCLVNDKVNLTLPSILLLNLGMTRIHICLKFAKISEMC